MLNPFLLDWLIWMRRSAPQLAVRTQVALPEGLMNQVSEGVIDIAVMYAPQHRPGLKIELLMKEKLVLVTTARRKAKPRSGDYVYVDWGADFAAHHNLSFPGAVQSRNLCRPRPARAAVHPQSRRFRDTSVSKPWRRICAATA
jgi:DNA-binding transcriptional LysR family regulator